MKKLLVLLLVLGVTGTSYGALADFDLDLSGTTLTVVGLNAVALNYGVYDESLPLATWSSPAILGDGGTGNAAGALALIGLYSDAICSGFGFMTGDTVPTTDTVDVMDWFTVQYNGSVGDVVNIYDNSSGEVLIGTKTIIPEPVTIALLGLGGLFLRRRK